jgi:hypothetical protein
MSDTGKVLGTIAVAAIVTGITMTAIAFGTGASVGWMLVAGVIFGVLYGLMAGLLGAYDLSAHTGVLSLLCDLSWSLISTVAGFVLGNAIYIFFGTPSRTQSENKGWISYKARGTSGFGVDVLQTIGTVNIGGKGNHERVHLAQARIFGPLFIPIIIVSYIVTGTIQILFTITLGAILKATGARETACFTPPETSAVHGFFGWIYYATPMELWAYATEPKRKGV